MDYQIEQILENRPMIETLVLGTFLKNLTLFKEYKISVDDFIYDKTKFFFGLGRAMSEKYNELDESAVLNFISTNKSMIEEYEEYGSFDSIRKAMEYSNINNIEGYVDDLAKNNFLINLRETMKTNVTDEITINGETFSPFYDKFGNMSCRDIENFYEGGISKCSVESINQQVKARSLIISKEERERLKQKEEAGTPYDVIFEYTEKEVGLSDSEEPKYIYSMPILSSITNGLHNGEGNTEILAHSNVGKSTITFFNFLLPMVYRGERAILISNEQGNLYFSNMLYNFIAMNVFKYPYLSRKKIKNGEFNDDEEILMDKIDKFLLDRKFDTNLEFINMEEFSVDEIMRVCKPYICHKGFSVVCIDTLKAEDSSSQNYTGKLVEAVKRLDAYGNKYKVKIIMTQQLQSGTELQNAYLTASEISEAKAVKTVADLLFLMRKVVNDLELNESNKEYFLKPYKLVKVGDSWKRRYITFSEKDKENQYRVLFVNKSRHGNADDVILLRFDGMTGRFIEVGRCEHVARKTLIQR